MIYCIEIVHQGLFTLGQHGPGTLRELGAIMDFSGLPHPPVKTFDKPVNLEFWFTEHGWKKHGSRILDAITRIAEENDKIRETVVLCAEKPRRSKIKYADKHQVALMAHVPSMDFILESERERKAATQKPANAL